MDDDIVNGEEQKETFFSKSMKRYVKIRTQQGTQLLPKRAREKTPTFNHHHIITNIHTPPDSTSTLLPPSSSQPQYAPPLPAFRYYHPVPVPAPAPAPAILIAIDHLSTLTLELPDLDFEPWLLEIWHDFLLEPAPYLVGSALLYLGFLLLLSHYHDAIWRVLCLWFFFLPWDDEWFLGYR